MVGREKDNYPLSTTKSIFLMQGGFGDRDGMGMYYGMYASSMGAPTYVCFLTLSEGGKISHHSSLRHALTG